MSFGSTVQPAGTSSLTRAVPPPAALLSTVTRNSRFVPAAATGTMATSGVIFTDSTGTMLTTFCFSPPTHGPLYRK